MDTREELFQASIVLSAHMLTYIRVKAKRGSHPSLATKVTGGCLLPVGMVIEAVSAHSCVFSWSKPPGPHQATAACLGSFRPSPSGLF